MAQYNKEQLDALLQFIDKLCADPDNVEFANALKKKFGNQTSSGNLSSYEKERLDAIYEYCIEEIAKKQAKEFYSDFPIKSITHQLEEDYVRMEMFRRKNNFGDFCLALYQQIECITNKLCESSDLSTICEKMWAYPAYVYIPNNQERKEPSFCDRPESEYIIAKLVFLGDNKQKGIPYYIEKPKTALQNLYANDKIRTLIYFVGFKATMTKEDYKTYKVFTDLMYDVYCCRNMNHRGNTLSEWERQIHNRILPLMSLYYFKFIGALVQYVEMVKNGFGFIPTLLQYANSLPEKSIKLSGPKVLGRIDLPEDNKKRFK